jgi:hypothetical protein
MLVYRCRLNGKVNMYTLDREELRDLLLDFVVFVDENDQSPESLVDEFLDFAEDKMTEEEDDEDEPEDWDD